MSTKVGANTVSARLKGNTITVKTSITHSTSLAFDFREYPEDAHRIDRIEWLRVQYEKQTGEKITAENGCIIHRILEAQEKEIQIILDPLGVRRDA